VNLQLHIVAHKNFSADNDQTLSNIFDQLITETNVLMNYEQQIPSLSLCFSSFSLFGHQVRNQHNKLHIYTIPNGTFMACENE
jgi:hypothetical protein